MTEAQAQFDDPRLIPDWTISTYDVQKRDAVNGAINLFNSNIITQNEARKMAGMSPVTNGDIFANGEKLWKK